MAKVGVKAIMFGGEGEPLLHKDFVSIVEYTKKCGIDIALTTNGTLLDTTTAKRILPHLSWIKFSIDAIIGSKAFHRHETFIKSSINPKNPPRRIQLASERAPSIPDR